MQNKLGFVALIGLMPLAGLADTNLNPPPQVWEPQHYSALPRAFQKEPYIDVMVHTDFSADGLAAPKGTAEHPIYYTGRDDGETNVGEPMAGERVPAADAMARILTESLRVSGFRPTDAAHPPTIFIRYRWGTFNRLSELPGGKDTADFANFLERAALVAGPKLAIEVARDTRDGTLRQKRDADQRFDFLVQEALDDRYFVVATAYDFAAAQQGKVKLLWSTKVSTNSRGLRMDESLPQLVASAAPYFGHETTGPIRLARPAMKAGQVLIGLPTYFEDFKDDPASKPSPDKNAPQAAAPAKVKP